MAEKRARLPFPAAVSDILAATFHGTPTEKRLREGKVWSVWEAAVGRQIADRAHPVAFRDGTLTVVVSSAPWMQQLNFLKKGIMEKLNSMLGEELVRDIYLRAGKPQRERSEEKPEKTPRRTQRPLTACERKRIGEKTSSITDPELREALAELLARHMGTGSKE